MKISSPQLPTCDSLVEGKKTLSFPQSLLDFPSPVCPSLGFGASLTLLKECSVWDPVFLDTPLGKWQILSLGMGFMKPRNGSSDPEKGTRFPSCHSPPSPQDAENVGSWIIHAQGDVVAPKTKNSSIPVNNQELGKRGAASWCFGSHLLVDPERFGNCGVTLISRNTSGVQLILLGIEKKFKQVDPTNSSACSSVLLGLGHIPLRLCHTLL